MTQIIKGKRATLKIWTIGGWRGKGTVLSWDQRDNIVFLAKDGPHHDALVIKMKQRDEVWAWDIGVVMCGRDEITVHRPTQGAPP